MFSLKFLLDVNNGDPEEHELSYNTEYIFSINAVGTITAVNGQDLYLRSNPYKETSITFLQDDAILTYVYTRGDVNGGHLNWTINEKCLFYNLYILKEKDANPTYFSLN